MAISNDALRAIPLFRDITDEHLDELVSAFQKVHLQTGDVLFESGSEATHLYVLGDGQISLKSGDETRFQLHPPAPIGELGALAGLRRNLSAVATAPSEVWQMRRSELMEFFEIHGDVAFPFYHNLMKVVAHKIRNDRRRLEEMRSNIIRTQKAMKSMRDLILETTETALSETIHDTLQDLIGRNRRSNYVVTPPPALPASIRLDDGTRREVRQLSAVWLVVEEGAGSKGLGEENLSGVLDLGGCDVPFSGTVREVNHEGMVVELDLLLDDYATALDDYLTRVQMLDVVV